jgi:hypothetical protein
MQIASPICEFVLTDHAMPLDPRLVFTVAVLFPADAGCKREASILIAVRRRASLGVLANKPDESNAIFAKHVFVFLSCTDRLGQPEVNGATSPPLTGFGRHLVAA